MTGLVPSGKLARAWFMYSKTRDRAQYMSVPSSKMTLTKESPKKLWPRAYFTLGAAASVLSMG